MHFGRTILQGYVWHGFGGARLEAAAMTQGRGVGCSNAGGTRGIQEGPREKEDSRHSMSKR